MKRISFLAIIILSCFSLCAAYQAKAETVFNSVNPGDQFATSLEWLRTNQNEDGSWGPDNEMKQLNSLTVVQLLGSYGYLPENYNKGLNWLQANPPQNNDYLARYLSIPDLATPEKINELAGVQNSDGGWGVSAGYASDSLDTALAIGALLNKEGYDLEISRAAEYLLSKQNPDGSWGLIEGGHSSVYLTGLARKVLLEYQDINSLDLTENLGRAADWLLANKNAQGGWGEAEDTVYLTCLAYDGLAVDMWQSLQEVPAYLESQLLPNGSVSDSPYLTALLLGSLSFEYVETVVELTDMKLYAYGKETSSFDAKSSVEIKPVYTGRNVVLEAAVISQSGDRYTVERDSLGRFYWGTGLNQAGDYQAEVVLKDSAGHVQGTLTKPFTILPFLEISQSYLEVIPGVTRLDNPVEPLPVLYMDCEINFADPVSVVYSVYSSVSGSVYESGLSMLLQKDIPVVLQNGENFIDLDRFTVDCSVPTNYTIQAEAVYQGEILSSRKAVFRVLENIDSYYTDDEDFDGGAMKNINHDEVHDQLQLNKTMEVYPYIWIANAAEGTLSKLNTQTGKEVARYRTGPSSPNPDPSRTAVDKDGNCWVANRGNGTVVKVAVTGGIDRNNNGIIDTSSDINGDGKITSSEMLPWGQDEAVLVVTTVIAGDSSSLPRALAIDKQGRIWVGLYNRSKYVVLDSDGSQTGITVGTVKPPYGASIDSSGYLWSASTDNNSIDKINTNNAVFVKSYNVGRNTYGIVADKNGIVWSPSYKSGYPLTRFNPVTESYTLHYGDGSQGRGVAVDRDGNIWAAYSGNHKLNKFGPSGDFLKSVTLSPLGKGPIGVGVDGEGYIWAVNQSTNNTTKLSTDGTIIGYYPVGRGPYTYSDMTGFNLKNITSPEGVWSAVYDAGVDNYQWERIAWHSQVPDGTGLTVSARTVNQLADLDQAAYIQVNNGQPIENLTGRFIQVEVKFTSTNQLSPVLEDINIGGSGDIPFADAGPDQVVPMTSSDGAKVILDGTGSYDPGGGQLTYRWTWGGGEAATPQPEVTLPEGKTVISLTVNNGTSDSIPDQVEITVVGPSSMNTSIITDKNVYLPDESVQTAVYGQNLSSLSRNLGLVVDIIDKNGVVLNIIETEAAVSWNPGEIKEFSSVWNCGTRLSGTYRARATWTEENKVIAVNAAEFQISSDGSPDNTVTTDKIMYTSGENAQIVETVHNTSSNAILSDLTVKTEILDQDGYVTWDKSTPVREILPGASWQYKSSWGVAQAVYGDYNVISTVYQGDLALCQDSAQFSVSSSVYSGQGITGSLNVLTKNIYPGDDVSMEYALTNQGNTDLQGIQIRITIVDPATGETVDTITDNIDMAMNETISDNLTWSHDILKPGNYLVVCDVTLDDEVVVPLDSSYFTVKDPYEITMRRVVRPRVLVWAESQINTDMATNVLNEMQVYYRIVNTRDAFFAELQSGQYNTYVMLNKSLPLTDHDDLVLTEEIAGGKGLVATGGSNGDNLKQFNLFGIKEIGSVNSKGYITSFIPGSPLGEFNLNGTGTVQRVLLTGGQEIASIITEKVTLPGVITHQYGEGKTVLMTFDLGEAGPAADAYTLFRNSLERVAPVQEAQGNVAEVEIKVQAMAAVETMLKEEFPAGTEILWVSPEFTIIDPPSWQFSTAPNQEYTFRYVVSLPGAGSVELSTCSYYLEADEYKLLKTIPLIINVP